MTCVDCLKDNAIHKCTVCNDVFCSLCGERHLLFYGDRLAKMIKIEDSTDAQTTNEP